MIAITTQTRKHLNNQKKKKFLQSEDNTQRVDYLISKFTQIHTIQSHVDQQSTNVETDSVWTLLKLNHKFSESTRLGTQ